MPIPPLFSDREIEQAENKILERTHLRINRAIWFSNALHALLRDVDRAQSPTPPVKILAVDTTDLIATTTYTRPHFSAFTFGELTAEQSDSSVDGAPEHKSFSNSELETWDKLTMQHLLVHREERYLLLDPYLEGFDDNNLENLQKFIIEQPDAKIPSEWDIFCNRFLPHWRYDMLETLLEKTKAFKSTQMLLKHGKFFFWRPLEAGERSVLKVAPLFDWQDYERFIEEPHVVEQYNNIHQSIQRLMGKISRSAWKTQGQLDRSAERDARAFAIVHTLNSFFHSRKINARIELVSRSAALHGVIAVLPEHRLDRPDDRRFHVTLRHPFLLPDIYGFDAPSLAAIAGVLSGLDAIISRYMTNEGFLRTQTDTDVAANEQEAKKTARKVVPFLKDILAIQQGLEQQSGIVEEIYGRTIASKGSSPRSNAKAQSNETALLVEKLKTAFQAITERLRSRSDPFTRAATFALIERNSALVKFEAKQVFLPDATVIFRVFDFRSDAARASEAHPTGSKFFGPVPCLTLRTVESAEPRFTRLVVIHSEKMIELLCKYGKEAGSYDETKPTEWHIPASAILEAVQEALESIVEDATLSGEAFNLDATLLACLIFAGKNRFDTAISLASTVLHPITTQIREGGTRWTVRSGDVRLSLACRELFLLRHYCERGLAMREYFGPKAGNVSVSKNFARAQRDLDFAMLMAEDAERVLARSKDERSLAPPAGVQNFKDFRLNLAQLAAWTDQYIIIADIVSKNGVSAIDWQDSELQTLRKRIGIWAAAGFVRQALTDAYEAMVARLALTAASKYEANQRRYLAYVEARALQGALTVFMVFLAYGIAPEMLEFWSLDSRPKRDRVLLFRDWREWWKRYSTLRSYYEFSVRADGLIGAVCTALEDLANFRRERREKSSPQPDDSTEKELHAGMLSNLQNKLRSLINAEKSSQFVRAIATAMVARLDETLAEYKGRQGVSAATH
jgi:hypothetical protein